MEVTEPPPTTVCLLTTELRANITKFMCFITTDASAPTVTASPLTEEGKINVSWTVPSVSSGTSIIEYSIQYKVSSSSGAYLNISDPGSSATNIVISGLRNGEDYLIRVAAKTELGIGSVSYGETSATTYDGEYNRDLNIIVTLSVRYSYNINSYIHDTIIYNNIIIIKLFTLFLMLINSFIFI